MLGGLPQTSMGITPQHTENHRLTCEQHWTTLCRPAHIFSHRLNRQMPSPKLLPVAGFAKDIPGCGFSAQRIGFRKPFSTDQEPSGIVTTAIKAMD